MESTQTHLPLLHLISLTSQSPLIILAWPQWVKSPRNSEGLIYWSSWELCGSEWVEMVREDWEANSVFSSSETVNVERGVDKDLAETFGGDGPSRWFERVSIEIMLQMERFWGSLKCRSEQEEACCYHSFTLLTCFPFRIHPFHSIPAPISFLSLNFQTFLAAVSRHFQSNQWKPPRTSRSPRNRKLTYFHSLLYIISARWNHRCHHSRNCRIWIPSIKIRRMVGNFLPFNSNCFPTLIWTIIRHLWT